MFDVHYMCWKVTVAYSMYAYMESFNNHLYQLIWFCDNAFISIQFLLKDYLSIFLKFLLTARQLLIEINLVIMRKKDLIDKKMIADHFLSAHF